MGLWETFGSRFQNEKCIPYIPNILKIPLTSEPVPYFGDIEDIEPIDRNLKNTVAPLTPDGVPDYAAWCGEWWRGCFACSDFLPDKVRFCRKWNRAFHGVDVVSVASMSTDDHPCPQGQNETTGQGDALSPRQTGGAWWCGRKEAAA